MTRLTLDDIRQAQVRLEGKVHTTPIVQSHWLNEKLGHRIHFKAECLQKIGAFKARGAYNTLAWLVEQNGLPERVVAYSSGNHAQAVAWAARQFGVKATILMPKSVSAIKAQATASYGAEVVFCESREQAESQAEALGKSGAYLIPPYDHEQIICGQGTAIAEALEQQPKVDALFVPCGGGGLLSGALIAARGINADTKVFGAEPLAANDAAQSVRSGSIVRLGQSPDTIADGVKTLAVSPLTFPYLQQTDGIIEQDEQAIIYWTQWLTHLLKLTIEPTSALSMAAAWHWLQQQTQPQDVMVLLSGGNMDHHTRNLVWQRDWMTTEPGSVATVPA